jgi:branched-chain amino acid transport system substrate-binding protein
LDLKRRKGGSIMKKLFNFGSILFVAFGCLSLVFLSGALAAPKPILIGGSLPQTGVWAETAKVIEKGYRFWVEEKNAAGGLLGRPLKLIIYDDQGKPDNAVKLAEKALTVDKADLLLGGYPGFSARAVMPLAEKHGMVYVSMGGHMKSFLQGYSYSFGSPPLMGEWWFLGAFQWLETIPPDQRPKRAAVYIMNNPVGTSLTDSVFKWSKKLGISIVINERYNLPLPAAEPLVLKAKQMKCDLFISGGVFPDGVMTVRAAKTMKYNPKVYMQGVGSIIPAWVKQLGTDGEYIVSGTSYHHKLENPSNLALRKRVKGKMGWDVVPTYFGFAYAWLQTLAAGIEGTQGLNQTQIRDWLRGNKVETVAGTFTFDQKGLPKPFTYSTQVIDGRVEIIWPLRVRTHEPVYPKPPWK